jgi:hypothetical protein
MPYQHRRRRTSIAAAVMINLKLSGFKIFNISLENFEATVGIAFILGYFGEHTERLLGANTRAGFRQENPFEESGKGKVSGAA